MKKKKKKSRTQALPAALRVWSSRAAVATTPRAPRLRADSLPRRTSPYEVRASRRLPFANHGTWIVIGCFFRRVRCTCMLHPRPAQTSYQELLCLRRERGQEEPFRLVLLWTFGGVWWLARHADHHHHHHRHCHCHSCWNTHIPALKPSRSGINKHQNQARRRRQQSQPHLVFSATPEQHAEKRRVSSSSSSCASLPPTSPVLPVCTTTPPQLLDACFIFPGELQQIGRSVSLLRRGSISGNPVLSCSG